MWFLLSYQHPKSFIHICFQPCDKTTQVLHMVLLWPPMKFNGTPFVQLFFQDDFLDVWYFIVLTCLICQTDRLTSTLPICQVGFAKLPSPNYHITNFSLQLLMLHCQLTKLISSCRLAKCSLNCPKFKNFTSCLELIN